VGLLVVATAGTTGPVAAAAPPSAPSAAASPGTATTVTLLTGDVVRLGGPNGAEVVAAQGREHIGFRMHTDVEGDVHVVPEDALAGVASGQLDPRLFDVSELAENGYGDVDRKDVPLIVDYPGATPRVAGARAVAELPSAGAVALRADKGPAFWSTALTSAQKIWLDGPVRASLDHSVPQIGAPAAWAAGHTGAGTTVAVLDTGIDATHPDLADAVVGARDFAGTASPNDRFGHGTHVASTITGAGDRYQGVAPDAKLLNGKVLDDGGGGFESSIIAGMEWAAASGADVVNMSLGTGFASDGNDPMSQAVNRITADTGTLFVISAGNSGPGSQTVGSPGAADAALTVGAVNREDELAGFSSRGPRAGDGAIKPDITAPGVNIVAARSEVHRIGVPVGDRHLALSGTSMAAPHVAGAAAILAGLHPDWRPEVLKATLMGSARPSDGLSPFEQGAGRVDVAAAVETTVSSSPVSVNFGVAQFPHQDDEPVTKTITYTNSGTGPVTLDVAAEVAGPGGQAAPAGMFTVSPSQVTVPAGGTADVTLTTDTRVDAADGVYSGALVATGGDTRVRTPITVEREVESYDVTLTFLDHYGNPSGLHGFRFVDRENPNDYWGQTGDTVVRVPKGTYYFDAYVMTQVNIWAPTTDFIEPALVVDAAHTEYTFDARDGVPLEVSVNEPGATVGRATVSYRMATEWGVTGSSWDRSTFLHRFSRPSRTQAPGEFEFMMRAQLGRPDGTGTWPGFHASPYLYNVAYAKDGGVPADLIRSFNKFQLAKVVSSYAAATPGMAGIRDSMVSMPLPYTLTEYYTPRTEWRPYFTETVPGNTSFQGSLSSNVANPRSYEPSRVTAHERWNVGVFGPGLPYGPDELDRFARVGDDFWALIDLFGDQNADTRGNFWSANGFTEGSTKLTRNGEVIYESPYPGDIEYVHLPPEESTYRLTTTATTPGPLSTRVDAEWTFRSGHVEGDTPKPVPALAVRLAPNLDDHNAAPAGRFRFPVHVQRNGADRPGQVNPPLVEVSYDDGQTWKRARLIWSNGRWQAEVDNPAGAKFASLRWSISDDAGNTAKATIIHAYALK
jgi:subtilisin family serine protease